jgi:hypothetical protein
VCLPQHLPPHSTQPNSGISHLVISIALVQQNIDNGQLVDVAVAFELLPDAGADGGDGVRDTVHGLDLGRLEEGTESVVRRGTRGQSSYRPEPGSICRNHSLLGIGPIGRCLELVVSRFVWRRMVGGWWIAAHTASW